MGEGGGKLDGYSAYKGTRWHRCSSWVTLFCLFCRMAQEVRKVAIWWVFISRWLPEWLNVSWRWSCRQLRGRAGPEAWGLVPGCSSSPLKEGQQPNESRFPPNLQLVLCQLYSISMQFSVFSWNLIRSSCPCMRFFWRDWKIQRCQSLLNQMIQYSWTSSEMAADVSGAAAAQYEHRMSRWCYDRHIMDKAVASFKSDAAQRDDTALMW